MTCTSRRPETLEAAYRRGASRRLTPVDDVIEQLWAPALESRDLRVVENGREDATWQEVERYWLVPSAAHARLLVPVAPPRVTARALTNYRHLRRPTVNVVRSALGAAARCHLPISRDFVTVQVRRAAPDAARLLPLPMLAEALGVPLFAAAGVRTGDNRKATLHLVDGVGSPVGYAKFGWSPATDALVRNEGRALRVVGGRDGEASAPKLLLEMDFHGHPVVVSEPLPREARGDAMSVRPPTAQEMFSLCPVVRRGLPQSTQHFNDLTARLQAEVAEPGLGDLAGAALTLATSIRDCEQSLPVTSLWHGDFTPWNQARDGRGHLWLWDWENSENDALAGLDAFHWASGKHRLAQRGPYDPDLRRCLADALPYLTAAGVQPPGRPVVAALFALTVVERACDLISRGGSWDDALIGPEGLRDLLRQATELMGSPG